MSISAIDQARVHITFAKDSIFTDERQPAKASVLVKLRPAARLEPQNVVAISNLVAGAVEGLSPDGVSVVDMRGNLLSHPKSAGSPDDPAPSGAAIEYKQAVERDLTNKIAATLTPLLGEGKFRAGVSADVDFSSGDQSEETFDPTKSVMTSSQKTEDITGGGTSLGVPGTASNLPSPPARPASARTSTARRTENISYETSRVVRRIHLPQGAIKRLSSSVLVDYAVRWQGAGPKAKRILDPPSPDKLKSIHDLVAAAIGFNAARGDELVIESLPFESTLNPEPLDTTPATKPSNLPPWLENLLAGKNYILVGVVAGVALLLAAIVAAVFLRSRKNDAAPDRPYHPGQLTAPGSLVPAQTYSSVSGDDPAERVSKEMEAKLAEQQALREKQAQEVLNSLKLPQVSTKKTEVLAKHVAEEAKKDPAVTAHLIRTWLHEGEA